MAIKETAKRSSTATLAFIGIALGYQIWPQFNEKTNVIVEFQSGSSIENVASVERVGGKLNRTLATGKSAEFSLSSQELDKVRKLPSVRSIQE